MRDFNMADYYKRENYLRKIRGFYHDTEMIKVITGVRRCGKSTILKMIQDELVEQGIQHKNIMFIHLDRRPYKSIKTADELEEAIDAKVLGVTGVKYIFIDEVQNVKDFEEVINAYREEKEYSIFITGSNSYMLSGELVTKLVGRYLEFEISTLTFSEYLDMKLMYGQTETPDIQREFVNYIIEGGFPQAVKYESFEDKRRYTEDVINEIYEKDIRRNKRIRKKKLFDMIQTFIINNFGATMSIKKMCEYLEKQTGETVRKETVYNYLSILVDAKIVSKCTRFDMKSKRSLNGEEKYYLTDLSFYFARNTDNRINYGPVLENIFYNYARSLDYKLSIGKIGSLEVDFILRDRNQNYAYVQIARTIDNDNYDDEGKNITEEREYRPLEKIADGYSKYLITMDTLLQRRSGIRHLNIVNLMSEGKELL